MDYEVFDRIITRVLNRMKEDTEHVRAQILDGRLSLDDYRFEAGVLNGFELASSMLIEEAEKIRKQQEAYDGV